MGDVVNIDKGKEKLNDVVAGFTFSRLPRGQRIATTLFNVFKNLGGPIENGGSRGPEDWAEIAKELEPYAVKDFAVRYGHLDDGKA